MIREEVFICVLVLLRFHLAVSWPESLISYGPPVPYNFGYDVYAPETGDFHGHHQRQDIRGYTSGSYYLLAPDGTWHETTFSDSGSGYNAIMKKRHKDDPPDYIRQEKALSMYFNLGNKNTLFLDSNIGIPVVGQATHKLEYPDPPTYSLQSDHPLLSIQPLEHFTLDGPSGPTGPHSKLMIARAPIPISTNVYLRPTAHNSVQFKRMTPDDFESSRRNGFKEHEVREHLTPPPLPPSPSRRPSPYPVFESHPFKLDFGPFSEDNESWKIGDMIDDDKRRDKIKITKEFKDKKVNGEEIFSEVMKTERPKVAEKGTIDKTTTKNKFTPETITKLPLLQRGTLEKSRNSDKSTTKTLIEQFQYRPIRPNSQEGNNNIDILKIDGNNKKEKITTTVRHSNEIITLDNIHRYKENNSVRPTRHSSSGVNQGTRNNDIKNGEKNKQIIKLGEDEHFRPILYTDKGVFPTGNPKIKDVKGVPVTPSTRSTVNNNDFKFQKSPIQTGVRKELSKEKPFESTRVTNSKNKPIINPIPQPVENVENTSSKFTHFKAVQKQSIDEIIEAIRKKKLEESKKNVLVSNSQPNKDKNKDIIRVKTVTPPKINATPLRPVYVRPTSPLVNQTSSQNEFKHNIPNVPQIDFDKLKKPGEVINKVKFIQLHGNPEEILPNLATRRVTPKPESKPPSRIFLPRDHRIVELLQKLSKERPDLVSTKPFSPSPPKPSLPKDVIETIREDLQSLSGADSVSSESSKQLTRN